MSTGLNSLNFSRTVFRGRPGSRSAAALGRPVELSFSLTPSRSEIVFRSYFSAVDLSRPTALALANGVGSNASRPSFSNSALAFSQASVASAGTFPFQAEERGQRGRGVLRVAGDLPDLSVFSARFRSRG